ncbi:uncharacterized protein cubi_00112 [Cryptosporidium ubiquitum]|uniref:Uncharacterized protein n=1 Tax=Cryptosporidium ubiquitum TaxID=857276 RepID=A0A1J4MKK3_9CRYT|nr:uncharacterized protein cubi_00112 [Cryptosporidium ubiquitum]OII74559.1 hypothetical protein cubi_00112 [Cryptosporidium ubiquitum]
MCNNNFFCLDSYPTYNKRCSCSCFDIKRGCSQQFTCTNRRPTVQRYICRICIPRVNRTPALQNRIACTDCYICGQRAGPASIQAQKPEAIDKCDYSNSCTCTQSPIQRSQTGGCRCGGCCIVLCSR